MECCGNFKIISVFSSFGHQSGHQNLAKKHTLYGSLFLEEKGSKDVARIRSIKPDFWRDEKICTLKNRTSALFFIGLWNVADDTGKFPLSAKSLSLQLPIFRTKEALIYISHLTQAGLIVESACGQWGLIVGWHHQKIDRPILPKLKNDEIQWLTAGDSSSPRESSSSKQRKDRIGKDRIGKELPPVRKPEVVTEKEPPSGSQKTNRFIAAYCELFKARYGSNPVVRGKEAGIAKRLAEGMSEENGEKYLQAFFEMPDAELVKSKHPLSKFEFKLNEITVFADSGKFTTRKQAQMADDTLSNAMLLNQVKEGKI